MSHYETLNVPKSADKETIKKAFRSKAKKAHPDKGGTTEEMSKLNLAYAVLSDEARKAKYDDTGEDQQTPSANEAAHGVLAQLFSQALETGQPDAVKFSRETLHSHLSQIGQSRGMITQKVARLRGQREDISVDSGPNLFHTLVDQQIRQGESQLRHLAQQESHAHAALELLSRYTSNVKVQPSAGTSRFYTSPVGAFI